MNTESDVWSAAYIASLAAGHGNSKSWQLADQAVKDFRKKGIIE